VSTSLEPALGRTPSAREVAEASGLTIERVLEAREAALAYRCDSLDRPVGARGEDGAATLGDRLAAPDDALMRAEDVLLVDQLAASALPPREREIVRLRFSEDLLQREIAQRVGLSQMHVSRVLRAALRRLREHAARDVTPVERADWRPNGSPGRERYDRTAGSSSAARDRTRHGVDLAAHCPE
jgi:RNA polymerase sigma-B factor